MIGCCLVGAAFFAFKGKDMRKSIVCKWFFLGEITISLKTNNKTVENYSKK